MRKAAFATLCFVLLVGLPALAKDVLDGNSLLLKCEAGIKTMEKEAGVSWSDLVDGAYCKGLVRGVSLASRDINEADNVTIGQEARVVVLYLENHPQELHKSDALLVHEALRKAFPAK